MSHLPSILGIQKGVALRLRRICSTDEEYNNKSKDYQAYLIGRGHKLNNVEESFNNVLNLSRQQSRIKKAKNTNSKNKIVFCSKYNLLGPNIKNIIQKHAHILDNCQIMENKEIMVAYKREKNLKELLTRADPYNIINNVDDEMYTYVPCKKRCDSCTNFVVAKSSFECFSAKSSFECFATKRVYKVRRSASCVSKNVTYIAFCLNCLKQGVGSTVDRKPRLRNYKSHIKKKVRSCSIVNHFIDVCSDTADPSRNIRFIIINQLDNVNSLSLDEIDDLLLQKERFLISTLVTIHKGLNSTHDWNRKRRTERPKQR